MKLLPISNSTEKFVQVKKLGSGVILRYARKHENRWVFGKGWFVPGYIWEVLRVDERIEENGNTET